MSVNAVQQLISQQVADLHRRFRERDAEGLAAVAWGKTVPPLPRCPACDAAAEQIDQRMEDPKFGVDETAVRLRWLPCGHLFRAVVDLDAEPFNPGKEPAP